MDQEATLSSQEIYSKSTWPPDDQFLFQDSLVDKGSLYSNLKTGSNQVFSPSPHSLVEIIGTAKKHSTHNLKGAGPNITLHTHMHTHQHMHTRVHRHTLMSLPLITHNIFRWFMGLQVLFCKEQLVTYLLIQSLLFLINKPGSCPEKKKKIKANWCWLRRHSKQKSSKLEVEGKNICQTELGKRTRQRRMRHSLQVAKNLSSTLEGPTTWHYLCNRHYEANSKMEHTAWKCSKFTSVAPLPPGIPVNIKMIGKAPTPLGKIMGVKPNTAIPTPFQLESCW